jgi:hypothetical protein
MGFLVSGTPERDIAAPLVGNYSFAHHTLDDTQDARIDKELGREAGSLKRAWARSGAVVRGLVLHCGFSGN